MSETALYPTVKRFLETAGFRVKGEVNGFDVVAVRDGDPPQLTVVEMKQGFSLELLLQAVDRMPRPDARRRGRLLSEYARRVGDPSPGGSTPQPVMTAYRQRALACAALPGRSSPGGRHRSGSCGDPTRVR